MSKKPPKYTPKELTRSQFDLFSAELSPFEQLTLRFIRVFDRALQKEGVTTLIGLEEELAIYAAELTSDKKFEFTPRTREYEYHWPESDLFAQDMQNAIMKSYQTLFDEEEKRVKTNAKEYGKSPKSKQKPGIARFEHTRRGNQNRFEVVTEPLRPVRTAMLGRAIMRGAYLCSNDAKQEWPPHAKDSPFIENLKEQAPHYDSVKFAPADNDTIYSQHANVSHGCPKLTCSFVRKGTDKNLMTDQDFAESISNALKRITRYDIVTLMTGNDSLSRLKRGKLDPHHLTSFEDATIIHPSIAKPDEARVEYRVPDASTHPFLSVLMTLAASYYAIKQLKAGKKVGSGYLMDVIGQDKLPDNETIMRDAKRQTYHMVDTYHDRKNLFDEDSMLLPLIEEVMSKDGKTKEAYKMVADFKRMIGEAYKANTNLVSR